LANDGVYEWSDETVQNISNDTVAPWFKSDTYFNRSRFPNAFAKYNAVSNVYELHLATLGSSTEDKWVQFNLNNRKWYGPNKTDLFTPSHAANMTDANGLPAVLVGATSGIIYMGNSSSYRDGAATAIDYDVFTPFYSVDAPDVEHAWLELSTLSKIESAGTLTVTPYVGRLNASAGAAISVDLTKGRQRLRRLGVGPMVRLRLQQATANQAVTAYGVELPFFEVGRR
jgi:transposase